MLKSKAMKQWTRRYFTVQTTYLEKFKEPKNMEIIHDNYEESDQKIMVIILDIKEHDRLLK